MTTQSNAGLWIDVDVRPQIPDGGELDTIIRERSILSVVGRATNGDAVWSLRVIATNLIIVAGGGPKIITTMLLSLAIGIDVLSDASSLPGRPSVQNHSWGKPS